MLIAIILYSDTDEDDASTTERCISSLNSHYPHPYKDHVRYSQLFDDKELILRLPAETRFVSLYKSRKST